MPFASDLTDMLTGLGSIIIVIRNCVINYNYGVLVIEMSDISIVVIETGTFNYYFSYNIISQNIFST